MCSGHTTPADTVTVELVLQARIKISDRPVRCLALTSRGAEPVIVSCAGSDTDPEAMLQWTRLPDDVRIFFIVAHVRYCSFMLTSMHDLYMSLICVFCSQTLWTNDVITREQAASPEPKLSAYRRLMRRISNTSFF